MKKLTLLLMALVFAGMAKAEDGHQLWLRYQPINKAKVTGPECIAAQELRAYSKQDVTLKLDASMKQDAYCIKVNSEQGKVNSVISSKNEIGL